MLLGIDEYPFHQTTQTFASPAGSDQSWNDGHYICAAHHGGEVAFTSNIRLYNNNDVMDGFVCLRHDGRQYNIRASRQLRPDVESLRVGPIGMEIIEPLQRVRFVVEPNDYGIEVDVVCTSRAVPYMGPIEISRVEGRLISERATYELVGSCEGTVRVGDATIHLDGANDSFFRNHSWGFQPGRGGPRRHGAPTPSRRVPGVRHWVLFDMPSYGGFFFDDPSGRAASGRGALMEHDRLVPITNVTHDIEWYDGGRRAKSGLVVITDIEGRVRRLQVDDLGWVYCQGGGYFGGFNDRLGQGVYRGVSHIEGESWDVSHPTDIVGADRAAFRFDHDWAENFMRVTDHDDGSVGLAHYECVVIDPTP